jgi:diacylglycerol kinase family enzyme
LTVAGIGVVVNPHAGSNRRHHGRAQRLVEIVGSDGVVRETGSVAQIDAVAREFHERRIDLLAICGGDGSFFHTISAVVRAYDATALPPFLPLRAGSMNTIARSVGCRHGSPERVLTNAVSDYRHGRAYETTERHLLSVNGRHYGFTVGAGVIVSFLRFYYAGNGRGPWAAARCLALVAISGLARSQLARGLLQYVEADIDCDGERVPHRRFNFVYGSTITDIGLGFKATYLATRKRGFFHLLAGVVRARDLVRNLRRLRQGWPLAIEGMYDNLAEHVRIEFPRPTHYMIDGEIMDPVLRVDVTTGPRLIVIRK